MATIARVSSITEGFYDKAKTEPFTLVTVSVKKIVKDALGDSVKKTPYGIRYDQHGIKEKLEGHEEIMVEPTNDYVIRPKGDSIGLKEFEFKGFVQGEDALQPAEKVEDSKEEVF